MPRDFSTTGSHRAQTEPEDLSAKPSAPPPADGVIDPSGGDPDQVDPEEKDPVVLGHNDDIDDNKENSSKTSPATTNNSTSSPLATSPPTSGTATSGVVALAQQRPQVVTTEDFTK